MCRDDFPHGLKGNLCSSTCSTFSYSLFTMGSSQSSLTVAVEQFLPFLKYVPTQYLPMLQMSSAVACVGLFWSWLELALFNMGAAPAVFSQK